MYFPLYFTEGGGYDPWGRDKNFAIFIGWLQCYNKAEMKNMGDHNKRTVFYCGDPGPMVPKGKPSRQLIEIQDRYIIQKLTLNFIVEGNRETLFLMVGLMNCVSIYRSSSLQSELWNQTI